MVKLDSTLATLAIAGVVAVSIGLLVERAPFRGGDEAAPGANDAVAQVSGHKATPTWAASATGRIEPKEGEVRISTQAAGKVEDVPVKANERVISGDLLIRLDDDDATQKMIAATAEALVRERERDEEEAQGVALERRKAEDALSDAERDLFQSRLDFDEVLAKYRTSGGPGDELVSGRNRIALARDKVERERANLDKVVAKPGMPLPTRLESSLTQARSDLSLAEAAVERMRIRAPSDGTVLSINAKVGETVAASADYGLITFGDVSSLRVRAEVEERDVVKVHVGQRVVVRADAYPDQDFEGVVTSIAPTLGPPKITSRGPRRPNDVEVLEVMAALDGTPPLLTGMRVDVFFKLDSTADAAPRTAH